MSPSESLGVVQELATLAGHPGGPALISARLAEMTRPEVEEALLSAVGALRAHYRDTGAWQAAALDIAKFTAEEES
jgi:hypothetical protein